MEIGAPDAARRVELESDVLIIGSGAGGAVMAAELTRRGLSVVMVEEGGHHKTESFNTKPSESFRRLYRDAGFSAMLGRPPIGFAEGRCVGGSTVVNGGMSWRTPDHILQGWAERGLPRLAPEDMQPYFERVEQKINVAYQSPESIGRDNALFKEGADKLGYRTIDNRRNQHNCLGSNNCMFGCPNGAKQSTLVTYIPEAMAAGATLVHGCRVERVLMKGTRAIGVCGRFVDARARPVGKSFVARARVVVSSAGAAQTPALLMRSGLRMPQLGKQLWIHPNVKAIGMFDEAIKGWQGVHQAYQIREFDSEGLLFAAVNVPPGFVALSVDSFGAEMGSLMERYNHMLSGGVLVEDTHPGHVRLGPGGQPLLRYQLDNRDMENFKRGVAILAELYFELGSDHVITPFQDFPHIRSRDDIKKMLAAKLQRDKSEIFTVHIMGTCRMGIDQRDSVCDAWGRVHGSDNLYVSDASIFPGPIGVNPMESVMALTTRNAEALAQRLDHGEAERAPGWRSLETGEELESRSFDELCAASNATLEGLMKGCSSPATEELEGYEFRGFNTPLITKLLGIRKFRKGFLRRDGVLMGYNVAVKRFSAAADWPPVPSAEKPKRFGFYEVVPVSFGDPEDRYPNALLLDYGRGGNPLADPSRLLRDYLVRVPSEGAPLLLGKAYLRLGPTRIKASYFVLERLGRNGEELAVSAAEEASGTA